VRYAQNVKGYTAPKTKAAEEQTRLLMERAEALRETPEDPLLLFSVLNGFWLVNLLAFNGEALRDLSAQFLALAERQKATAPLMIGHRLMGTSLLLVGEMKAARAHFDQAISLYNAAEQRPLAIRFGIDHGVFALCHRSWACGFGYPAAAITDANRALKARARPTTPPRWGLRCLSVHSLKSSEEIT
jgi:hypothetical protein